MHLSSARSASTQPAVHRRPILLVDTVGELGAWWGTATIAFVGGSFGSRGGQNMLEPAAYGAAVSFGPNTWNFRDIVAALLAADAAVVVQRCSRARSRSSAAVSKSQLTQLRIGASRSNARRSPTRRNRTHCRTLGIVASCSDTEICNSACRLS